ncbi:MAG: hypothetical protein K2K34_09750 [Oscillospiraceae bacterium]|nr:hypothetical protein [Oscillospiraceae bacterium]
MPKGAFDEEHTPPPDSEAEDGENSSAFIIAKAVAGAVIGSIPACILWISLGRVGYIASVCGFFMIFGEMYLCSLFTKNEKDMNIETAIVVCIVVTIAMVYLCERAVWSYDLYYALAPECPSVGFCFVHFEKLITGTEISADFDSALFRSYIFAAIGAATSSFRALKFQQ